MRFTWHPAKKTHCKCPRASGSLFGTRPRIFGGPTVERTDDRFEYGEVRVYAIGLVNGIEITVIYTDRDLDERTHISWSVLRAS